ncbi:MAG: hypothetical protein ACREHD_29730 [Pirellulales bacterium]
MATHWPKPFRPLSQPLEERAVLTRFYNIGKRCAVEWLERRVLLSALHNVGLLSCLNVKLLEIPIDATGGC